MTLFQAILLGIIQGITEFIPISSSGHLVFIPYIFGWESHEVAFDIFLHLGTLLALIVYFRKMLFNTIKELGNPKEIKKNPQNSLLLKITIAIIPAILIGLLFKDQIDNISDSILIIIFNLIFLGIIFIISDKFFINNTGTIKELGLKQSFIIGCFQVLAFFRGTSRSGVTIIGGSSQKLSYKESAEFSFLIGIPTIAGAAILQLKNYQEILDSQIPISYYIVGMTTSFLVGLICIKFIINWINKIGLKYFGIYRIVIGIILIMFFLYR